MTADAGVESGAPPQTTRLYRTALLVVMTLASTLYGTTFLIVTVILPQMQGSLSATQDQISWVVTFNILATAMATPTTGWLVARFGRRQVLLFCLAGFTVATFLCGTAMSLEALVVYRVAQGALGAPLVPLGQAVILDSYPREQHGYVTSVFGMGVVIGPVIGPVLGGYLAEVYNWRWAFFMLVPCGVISWIGLLPILTDGGRQQNVRLDWTGFLALMVAVVGFQLMLDRGERADWFSSNEIIIEALAAGIGLYVFVVHSMTTQRPFLNPALLRDRNYAIGLLLVLVYGMLNFTPMVVLPPMLKGLIGYPDSIIGELLAWRGAGAMVGFFLAMYIGKLDPRIGLVIGFSIQAYSGWMMMGFDLNVTTADVAAASLLQGMAVGLIWVPLIVASFSTLDSEYLAESSAVFHLGRNIGSALFVSLSVTTLIRSGNANYSRMTEFASHANEPLVNGGRAISDQWGLNETASLARLAREISRQASMLGYLDAFALYTLASIAALPLILLVSGRKRPTPG